MGRSTERIAVPYLQLEAALSDICLKKTETRCSCQCTHPVSMSCIPAFFFPNVANCKQWTVSEDTHFEIEQLKFHKIK